MSSMKSRGARGKRTSSPGLVVRRSCHIGFAPVRIINGDGRFASSHGVATELIKRIVTPDILSQKFDSVRRGPKGSGVDGACLYVDVLTFAHFRHRVHDLRRTELSC